MASNDLLLVMMKISEMNEKIEVLSERVGEIEKYIDERLVVTLNELMCKFDSN